MSLLSRVTAKLSDINDDAGTWTAVIRREMGLPAVMSCKDGNQTSEVIPACMIPRDNKQQLRCCCTTLWATARASSVLFWRCLVKSRSDKSCGSGLSPYGRAAASYKKTSN